MSAVRLIVVQFGQRHDLLAQAIDAALKGLPATPLPAIPG